jgi:outer membrane receptor protein involved in Fe transport
MDWKDQQVSASYQGAFSFITNSAGKARVRGIEIESTIMPADGLTLRASGSYTTSKLLDDVALPSGITICDSTKPPPYTGCAIFRGTGVKGDELPYTSNWTFQGQADYKMPVSDTMSALFHADVNYRSNWWTTYAHSGPGVRPEIDHLDGYATVNVRVGVDRDDGRWGAYVFINNLFNKLAVLAKTSSATSSTIAKTVINGQTYDSLYVNTIEPRVMGVGFRTNF